MKITRKNRQGAASFYVIAFSTLILLVVVSAFTALVVAQITRSSNDDLSQSAYDAALAGIEDAKLAFYNYQACVAQGAEKSPQCDVVIGLIEEDQSTDSAEANCDVVAKILGRTLEVNEKTGAVLGVKIKEGTDDNNMQEWYTCVRLTTKLPDYRATLTPSDPIKVVKAKFGDDVQAKDIERVKVSWGSTKDGVTRQFLSKVGAFPQSDEDGINPPVLGVALVQASDNFKMADFNASSGSDRTNRGLVYMQPSDKSGSKLIDKSIMVASNSKKQTNEAQLVRCDNRDSEFLCQVEIELPKPVGGGERSDDNFMIAVMLPYGSSTDFALEFLCKEGRCASSEVDVKREDGRDVKQAELDGLQVRIDSTGRANDLFRRVEARLEGSDSFAISLLGPLELFGDGGTAGSDDNIPLKKDYAITCEYQFEPTNPSCMDPL